MGGSGFSWREFVASELADLCWVVTIGARHAGDLAANGKGSIVYQ